MASDMESQMVYRLYDCLLYFLYVPNSVALQVSVERVRSYTNMPQEPSHYLPTDPAPMAAGRSWPSQGAIRFGEIN